MLIVTSSPSPSRRPCSARSERKGHRGSRDGHVRTFAPCAREHGAMLSRAGWGHSRPTMASLPLVGGTDGDQRTQSTCPLNRGKVNGCCGRSGRHAAVPILQMLGDSIPQASCAADINNVSRSWYAGMKGIEAGVFFGMLPISSQSLAVALLGENLFIPCSELGLGPPQRQSWHCREAFRHASRSTPRRTERVLLIDAGPRAGRPCEQQL